MAKKSGEKTDAVFAYTKRGRGYRKVRVSEFMSQSEALDRYYRLDSYNPNQNRVSHADRTGEGAPLGAGGGPVLWLAVRPAADPNWNTAPRVTATLRTRAARNARAKVRAL